MKTQKTIIDETGYEELEDPNFFKFVNIGDKVAGKLIDIGTSDQYKFGLYTVEQADGTMVRFHGSVQLDTRMKQCQIGEKIMVEFTDVERRPKGDMKLYSVRRKK